VPNRLCWLRPGHWPLATAVKLGQVNTCSTSNQGHQKPVKHLAQSVQRLHRFLEGAAEQNHKFGAVTTVGIHLLKKLCIQAACWQMLCLKLLREASHPSLSVQRSQATAVCAFQQHAHQRCQQQGPEGPAWGLKQPQNDWCQAPENWQAPGRHTGSNSSAARPSSPPASI
jgi:hypothetical protein